MSHLTPPPNPNADKARAAMREYAGIPAVHIPQHATTKREPFSAALLAQAADIEPGRTIVIDADLGIIEVDAPAMQIVTWRGTCSAANETAAKASGGRTE